MGKDEKREKKRKRPTNVCYQVGLLIKPEHVSTRESKNKKKIKNEEN